MRKIFTVLFALAMSVPISLNGLESGSVIYAKPSDSITADQSITIEGEEITEFPYELKNLKEDNYTVRKGSNVYTLTIDDTAPTISTDITRKAYQEVNSSILITGATEGKVILDGEKLADVTFGNTKVPVKITENGKHEIKVTAEDEAGNKSELNLSFTVNNEKPVIDIKGAEDPVKNSAYDISVSVASALETTNTMTLDGKEIEFTDKLKVEEAGQHTLTVKAVDSVGNEAAKTVNFEIDNLGPKVTINKDSGSYKSADITVSAEGASELTVKVNGEEKGTSFTLDKDGIYNLEVVAKDEAGNETRITRFYRIHNTAPEINVEGLEKLIQNKDYNIRITTVSDIDKEDTIILDGEEKTSHNLTVSDEGKHNLVVKSKDSAGNEAEKTFDFEIDLTDPVLTYDGPEGKYQKEDINYSFSSTDNIVVTMNGSEVSPSGIISEEGSYSVKAVSEDEAGNKVEESFDYVLDKTKPVITISEENCVNDLRKIRAEAEDTNFDKIKIKASGKTEISGESTNNSISLPNDAEGVSDNDLWTFTVTAEDKAGNVQAFTKQVYRDTTAPAVEIMKVPKHINKDVKAESDITDTNLVSSEMSIVKDGKEYDTVSGISHIEKMLSEEGEYTVTVRSVDKAGNRTSESISFEIDKTPPEVSLDTPKGHHKSVDEVSASSNEDGKVYMKVVVDGDEIFNGEASEFKKLGREGIYNVSAWATDLAGNVSKVKSQSFVIDKTAPKISLKGAKQNVYYNKPVTITAETIERFFDGTDVSVTGYIDKGPKVSIPFKCTSKDTKVSKVFKTNGTYHLKMKATDKAGNTAETKELVFTVDTKKPEIEIAAPDNATYDTTMAPKITIKDDYFDSKEISLSGGKNFPHKDKFGLTGGTRQYSDFARLKENDGKYTLTATAKDKAGNTTTVTKSFIVNRFGSSFKTIKTPSEYVREPDENVVIEETNVSGIKDYKCEVSRDAKRSEAEDVRVRIDGDKTRYTIPKSNFEEDGIYKVFLTTVDNSGNTSKSKGDFSFTVDSTDPVITYTGIEEGKIYKESKVRMDVSATDSLTKSPEISVTSGGKKLKVKEDNGKYYVNIPQGINQTITIKATDRAGNTATQEISDVTVSTSRFAFFAAHKGLTAAVAAIAAVLGGLIFLLTRRKKKGNEGDDITL